MYLGPKQKPRKKIRFLRAEYKRDLKEAEDRIVMIRTNQQIALAEWRLREPGVKSVFVWACVPENLMRRRAAARGLRMSKHQYTTRGGMADLEIDRGLAEAEHTLFECLHSGVLSFYTETANESNYRFLSFKELKIKFKHVRQILGVSKAAALSLETIHFFEFYLPGGSSMLDGLDHRGLN